MCSLETSCLFALKNMKLKTLCSSIQKHLSHYSIYLNCNNIYIYIYTSYFISTHFPYMKNAYYYTTNEFKVKPKWDAFNLSYLWRCSISSLIVLLTIEKNTYSAHIKTLPWKGHFGSIHQNDEGNYHPNQQFHFQKFNLKIHISNTASYKNIHYINAIISDRKQA